MVALSRMRTAPRGSRFEGLATLVHALYPPDPRRDRGDSHGTRLQSASRRIGMSRSSSRPEADVAAEGNLDDKRHLQHQRHEIVEKLVADRLLYEWEGETVDKRQPPEAQAASRLPSGTAWASFVREVLPDAWR